MIPVNKFKLKSEDRKILIKSLKNNWISSAGPEVKIFENKFKKLIGKKYCSSVSSGSAALDVALKVIDIKKGDEVIIPNFTIISPAISIVKLGAKPVPIDCDLYNWNMKIEDIEKKITNKTKALMVTHIYSYPNDMDKLLKICKKYKLYLIEDAAEVIGLNYKKKICGSFGDISTFSFYANKQITTGEGGMISTNNLKLANKCRSLRNLSFGIKNRFNHDDIGWNYRMTNIQAALGLSQLKNINSIVKKKIFIGEYYYKRLKDHKYIYMTSPSNSFSKNIYWVVGILIKNKRILASKIITKLRKYGIGARPFFWPMNEQKIFKKMKIFDNKKYSNSKYLSRYGFYIPSYIDIKKRDMDYVISILNKIIK